MENASKALIMAASVLIGVVILSLTAYLFMYFGGSVNEMNQQIEEGQLQQFNNQFTSYEDRDNLTIYDVITVANLAKENNTYYGLTKSSKNNFYIEVKLGNTSLEAKDNFSDLLEQKTENGKLHQYRCKVEVNFTTGRVSRISFKQKT